MRPLAAAAVLALAVAACSGEPDVTVPQVVPDYADEAVATLGRAGLEASMDELPPITRADMSVNGYAVMDQDPAAGATAPRGSTVSLELAVSVNAGPGGLGEHGVVSVPDLVGLRINQAIARATQGGLYATVLPPEGPVDDLVISGQSLEPGERVQAGAEIRLTVA